MTIISTDQHVTADISYASGLLDIDFGNDPSYALSESVIIDLMRRSIGIIFQQSYHHIGFYPSGFAGDGLTDISCARLHGSGEKGREVELHAPIKVVGMHKEDRVFHA